MLRPVLTAETADLFVSLAENRSVSELEAIISTVRKQGAQPEAEGNHSTSKAVDAHSDMDAEPEAEQEPGRLMSFPAPISARLAFEEGIERARQMLGYDARRHACVAAMLAEAASSGWVTNAESVPDPGSTQACQSVPVESRGCKRVPSGEGNGTAHSTATESSASDDAECHENESRIWDTAAEVDGAASDPRDERIRRFLRKELHQSRQERAERAAQVRRSSAETAAQPSHGAPGQPKLAPGQVSEPATEQPAPASPLSPILRQAMAQAEATLRKVEVELDGFAQLLDNSLTGLDAANPSTYVERIEELRIVAGPMRVLALHVLRDLINLSASSLFGYRSHAAFALDRLRVSERTFRALLHESHQLELRPEIEQALLSGGVGCSKRRLLEEVDRHRLPRFLDRARDVTCRQLAREVRLHEKLRALRSQLALEESVRACSVSHDCENREVLKRDSETRAVLKEDPGRRSGVKHDPKGKGTTRSDARSRPIYVLPERMLDPLPQPGLERALRRILLQHGWSNESIERELRSLDPTVHGNGELEGESDGVNAGATGSSHEESGNERADCNEVANGENRRAGGEDKRTSEENERANRETGFADGANGVTNGENGHETDNCTRCRKNKASRQQDANEKTRRWLNRQAFGMTDREIQHLLQIDPAANPMLMRRIELLVHLALLAVCSDSLRVHREVHARGRQTLNPDGPLTRIRFWAPDSVRLDLEGFFNAVRLRLGPLPDWAAFSLLLREAIETWRKVDPEARPRYWRVYERDAYHCQTPGCTCRHRLEAHHLRFRSRGGSDCPFNLITACYGHHGHGIHEGYIVAWGNASTGLYWIFAPNGKGGAHRTFIGDRRIRPGTGGASEQQRRSDCPEREGTA